jgi:hypothetical protein
MALAFFFLALFLIVMVIEVIKQVNKYKNIDK